MTVPALGFDGAGSSTEGKTFYLICVRFSGGSVTAQRIMAWSVKRWRNDVVSEDKSEGQCPVADWATDYDPFGLEYVRVPVAFWKDLR